MPVVGPMQPTLHQIVDVVAVRDRLMAAALTVTVRGVAGDGVGVATRVGLIDCDQVLVDVVPVGVV